ncbi:MAG: RNA polymerase sigma factor [Planctomycetes bacterium]|nr:RNA polymerase sigma factor [Planctomycetota bacterium]
MKATLTDEELLARVAAKRDREAFQQLFERYAKPAFNLARFLARDDARAEDAVQEAMLRVWLKAGQFDPARGAARTWILRVVANKTLAAKRNLRDEKGQAMTELDDVPRTGTAQASAAAQAEERELAAALRTKMNELPAALRQVMALYYVCEMKQSEIAESLAMPQTTVSLRIREGLAELRKRLEVAGFAAAVPMLSNETIGAALLDGREAPRGLAEKILSNLDRAAAHSARAVAAGGHGVALWAGAVLILAAGAGWWMLHLQPPAKTVNAAPAEKSDAPEPAAEKAPRTGWNFNAAGDAADLALVKDSRWHWVADGGPDGSGCMETDTKWFSVNLGVPAGPLPVKVKLRYQPQPPRYDETGWMVWMLWSQHGGIADFWNIAPQNELPTDGTMPWMEAEVLITERYQLFRSGVARHLFVHERRPGAQLQLGVQGKQRIDDIRIEPLDPKDLPDVSVYLDALAKIPQAQRKGQRTMPELPCPLPGRKVVIHFYPKEAGVE